MSTGTPATGGFGEHLHGLRTRAGLSQEDLAHAAGVSVRALSDLERGRARGPQRRTVEALATALKLDATGARELERVASLGRPRPARQADAPPPAAAPDAAVRRPDAAAPRCTPDLLPRAPRGFHGRTAELAALSRATAGEAPVCLVIGPAGVGKTALVLHWAHHNPAGLTGGRLYADLRGFSDTGEVAAIEVLREFLLVLDVPHGRIPESENGASALFRSLAADRQLLVVLDNARDSEQVRPLLPGGDRCVTVVTSRHRLPGLIITDAARPVAVDVLTPQDATTLLARILGTDRVHAEPAAALRLGELCGGLPLALGVTAARLAGRPDWTLAEMAAELSDETRRLSLLDLEDTGVRAALRLTVRQLPAHVSPLFAALGRHPGTHVDRYAAAALASTDPTAADAALERLAVAHLLTETTPGRWTMHDLVRLYARGLDAHPDTLKRVLDYYITAATGAVAAAEPGSEDCFPLLADFSPPSAVREFADRSAAVAWYSAERNTLVRAVAAAHAAALHGRTWRIVMTMWPLIVWRVRDGWVPLLETALAAARTDADPHGEARVLNVLGWVLTEEGRTPEALVHLEAATALAAEAADAFAEANALIVLAMAQAALGGLDDAAKSCERAAELARASNDRRIERLAMQHLARHQADAGHWRQALTTATHALAFNYRPDTTDIPHILLLTIKGEALLGLGNRAEGIAQLDLAAREAESAGYDDGAVRALGALLRATPNATVQARYDTALTRLTTRS
ncbi:helix-turn-helix domain-containing protein [Streptomyces sp. NBC_00237]|uniref:helix-turn-helix domain-containing protein n=1 Tax=Streptomyces sp. NBC_00237 TaxID=2975687 RepID=UPI00225BA7DE|nr:helix-turn-helix domain-containing protein [Streptomyces sp. NBC_00237]MCX5206139.1 helix-turn-helix domain-containing protein [Streptomyces sp. NBC_00237]